MALIRSSRPLELPTMLTSVVFALAGAATARAGTTPSTPPAVGDTTPPDFSAAWAEAYEKAAAFVRSGDPDLFPSSQYTVESLPKDTTTGKGAPDLELFFTPVAYKGYGRSTPPNFGHYNFMLHAVTLRCVRA